MAKSTNYVLDSFALIGYLENEPFAQEIEDLLHQAEKGVSRLYLHALHLGEVFYITLRAQGQDVADLAYARIKRFPVKFAETINEELLLTTAALAKVNNALLLTGDPEFRTLEADGILEIHWLT